MLRRRREGMVMGKVGRGRARKKEEEKWDWGEGKDGAAQEKSGVGGVQ